MLRKNYNIGQVLGRGSVGVVYEATSIGSSRRVAIKVMHAPIARTDAYRNAFLREVQALAKLHHRSIVQIFDFGELEADFEDGSGTKIPKGSPYLVMEFIDGEDLNDHLSGISWDALKFLIRELLDALAHAHARNVLHRDLKPQNVVLCRQFNGRFSIKIVDFGLARPDGALKVGDATQQRIEGTPAYMSPELVRGDVRSQGPWTDLYALGCMLWEITTGELVFAGLEGVDMLYAQASQTPPEYRPTMPVPKAFESWLRKLLEKSRFDRYEFAPDATDAFIAFMDAPAIAPPGAAPTKSTFLDNPPAVIFDGGEQSSATDVEPVSSVMTQNSWTQNLLLRRNIFRHRSIPMVGRFAERDLALEAFAATCDDQRPRVLWVQGESGVGKSKFADWFVQSIREEGSGWEVEVSADKGIRGVTDGMSKFFAIDGLSYKEARERIREWVLALTYSKDVASHESKLFANTFLLPDVDGSTSVYVPIANKIEVVKRATRRLAWRRPVVLVLNDFNSAPDIQKLISHILRDPDPLPVLLLVLQDASVEKDPMLEQYSDQTRRVIPVELHRLTEPEQRELASALVGRNEKLIDMAIEHANGRPVMILKTIEDWFERGLVSVDGGDVRVSGTEPLNVPADEAVIWSAKLDAAEEDVEPHRRGDFVSALELAATLGRQVIDSEWRAVRRTAISTHSSGFSDILLRHQILQATDTGWTFSQASIRREILKRAESRVQNWHRVVGTTLGALYRKLPPSRRIVAHFEQAGTVEDALPFIWTEFRTRCRIGLKDELADVHKLLGEIASQVCHNPEDQGRVWASLADELIHEDHDISRIERLAALATTCEEHAFFDELAMVCLRRGQIFRSAGQFEDCLGEYEHALTALRDSDDTVLVCATLLNLAEAMTQSGRITRSVEFLAKAKELVADEDATQIAQIWAQIATIQLLTSDWRQAETSAKYALEAAERSESPKALIAASVALGDVYRWISDTTQCEHAYQKAKIWVDQQHRSKRVEFLVKVALARLAGGNTDESKSILERTRDVALPVAADFVRNIALLCCFLQTGEKVTNGVFAEYLPKDPVHTPDAVWATRRLAQLCEGTSFGEAADRINRRVSKLS